MNSQLQGVVVHSPIPLEEEFPQLAEHFRQMANKEHPTFKSVNIDPAVTTILMKNGQVKHINELGPYDPCWCGSSKKYKFCHGKK